MQPIVDGLQREFGERVAFRTFNALDGGQGQRAFEQLRLPGHPSYLIFRPDGSEAHRSFGLVDVDTLREAITSVLDSGQPP